MTQTKLNLLSPDDEFVLTEAIQDGFGRTEVRLWFYTWVRKIDEKRIEVLLHGCVQIPCEDGEIELLGQGLMIARPRYSNLDARSSITRMSGSYQAAETGAQVALMRTFYRDLNMGIAHAILQMEEIEMINDAKSGHKVLTLVDHRDK
jgi:hypothetical protein